MKKSDREIMEILVAFDATECPHSAAQLAGVDPKTVRRYVAARDAGRPVTGPGRRPRIIDEHLPKIEEWVDRSEGKARADVIHARLVGLGFTGTERTTRRAVAAVKAAWRAGNARTYRPWITEPGLWLQFDWGEGPKVPGPDGRARGTLLFCAWLAWSRYRVVIPTWDQSLPTLVACLDATFRTLGGVPSYVLTDNARTVTIDHVAGVPVRHPDLVTVARHYGTTVHTCVPYDPQSKGGTELACRVVEDDRWCRRCGCEGTARDSVVRELAHEPFGWRPTTLSVTVRRYRCGGCAHVWRQDTSKAADARAKVSRAGLAWALTGLVVQHLTVARVAEALGVAWNTANDAVLAEGKRVLIADPARFDGVAVVGVDEHVVRHEALLFRMEVRDLHRLAVAAAG